MAKGLRSLRWLLHKYMLKGYGGSVGPGGNQMSPELLREAISSQMVRGRSFPAESKAPGCSASWATNVLDGCLHPGTSMDVGGSGTEIRVCNSCPARVPKELAQK